MNAQSYKTVCPKAFDFWEILKMRKKIFDNPRTFVVVIALSCTKRRRLQMEPNLIVIIEPKSLVQNTKKNTKKTLNPILKIDSRNTNT